MKPRLTRFLFSGSAAFSIVMAPATVEALTYTRNNTGTNLSALGSWSGGPPGSTDTALFNSTSALTAASNLVDTSLSWNALQVTNITGVLSIGNGSATTLSIGSGGIDMSAAAQNVYLNNSLSLSGAQTWTVAGGRVLGVATTSAETTYRSLTGSGSINLVQSGTGTATVKVLTSGTNTYTGNWTVGSNVELQFIRNGLTGLGSGTVTLSNGSVLAQTQGNWQLSNSITLGASSGDTVTIGNRSSSTTQRRLKLDGVLSGSGNVVFNNYTTNAMTSVTSAGFALTNTNTFTGSMTINSGAFVRLGGTSGNDTNSWNAGTTGSVVSTVSIINNGGFILSRSNAHTVNNVISGAGVVYLGGGNGTALGSASSQDVTLGGNNTYSGGTDLTTGILRVNHSNALGTGTVTFTGSSTLATASSGTARTIANAVNINTGVTASFDSGFASLTLAGNIGGAGNLSTTSIGTTILTGTNGYTGTTTIVSGSGLQIGTGTGGGTTGTLGAGAVTNNGALAFNRSNALNVSMAIGGTGTVSQNGGGTTTLSGISNYTGSTSVSAGTLLVTLGNTATAVTGGTLGGNGTVGGAVSIGINGILSSGATTADSSIGTLNLGSLTMSGLWQVGATGNGINDRVDLGSGSLNVSGGTIAFNTSGYTVAFNDSFDLATFGGTAGGTPIFDFSGASTQAYGMWDTSAFASTGVITYVPETHAAILGSIGVMCLLRRRRP
jgi:fibronectin-binding autotransporter adhesin